MVASLEQVIEAALELTESERVELITTLISTFSPADAASPDDAWLVEISRRSAEFDAGIAQTLPWAEVKEQARRWQATRG